MIELQNRIVDPRFRESDYRTNQNYVGETVAWQKERIHYACPKPEDLASLMEGLVAAHKQMEAGGVSAVGHAAAVAYGFVFLHPFEDGNGRIHRFLIHNILARRGFTPEGIMFPVSASMLKDLADYDASLEAFSRPLMALVEYSLDEEGRMTVRERHGTVVSLYRYDASGGIALPVHRADHRYGTRRRTGFPGQLRPYQEGHPGNRGHAGPANRPLHPGLPAEQRPAFRAKAGQPFDFLSDDEVARMEQAVQSAYGGDAMADK